MKNNPVVTLPSPDAVSAGTCFQIDGANVEIPLSIKKRVDDIFFTYLWEIQGNKYTMVVQLSEV